jgi:hypothetical protein
MVILEKAAAVLELYLQGAGATYICGFTWLSAVRVYQGREINKKPILDGCYKGFDMNDRTRLIENDRQKSQRDATEEYRNGMYQLPSQATVWPITIAELVAFGIDYAVRGVK